MTLSYGATTTVVGTWISQYALDVPEAGTAWWAYGLIVAGAGTVAWAIRAVIKLILDAYRSVQTGDTVPRITVDLLIAQFEARLAAKDAELDKIWTAYHLEAQANQAVTRSEQEQANVAAQSVMQLMESLQRARAETVAEVAPNDNGSATRRRTGRTASSSEIGPGTGPRSGA